MKELGAALAAVIAATGYYGAICILNQRCGLALERKKGWFWDGFVWGFGLSAFGAAGILGYIRLPGLGLPQGTLTLALILGMAALAVADWKKQVIPNFFLLFLLLLWTGAVGIYMIKDTAEGLSLFFRSAAGCLTGGAIFLLCYLISGRKLGAGDVKLAFVMGLYLTGQRIIGAFFYGLLLCCIYSMVQMCRKKLGLKDGVPMVPFLYLGVLITLFIG